MYERKILIILRAALIVVGAAVVGTSVWQYFVYYPDVIKSELQIVVILVSAAVGAALLGLSAKPFYRLGASIGAQFSAIFIRLGAKGVAAIIGGLALGAGVGAAFYFSLKSVITILSVLVLSDILVTAAAAAIFCALFSYLATKKQSGEKKAIVYRGYFLCASCFFDDRVFVAAETLDKARVSDGAFKAILKYGDAHALARLKAVSESDRAVFVRCDFEACDDPKSFCEYEREYAKRNRLKAVDLQGTPLSKPADASLTAFCVPSREAVDAFSEKETDEKEIEKTPLKCDDGKVSGRIIIDKR